MVELVSSYSGFVLGLFEFFWVRIIEADWYFVPILALGFLLALFFILGLPIQVLAAIWAIIQLLLSYLQRLTGIKFPFIGNWLEAGLTASEKRIAKEIDDMQKHEVNRAVAYLKYNYATKELPDDEIIILRKILQLVKPEGNILEALTKYEQIPDEDKEFYRKQFETGELDKWMETYKQNGAYST